MGLLIVTLKILFFFDWNHQRIVCLSLLCFVLQLAVHTYEDRRPYIYNRGARSNRRITNRLQLEAGPVDPKGDGCVAVPLWSWTPIQLPDTLGLIFGSYDAWFCLIGSLDPSSNLKPIRT